MLYSIYNQGRQAFFDGQLQISNPYSTGSFQELFWNNGYRVGKQDYEKHLAQTSPNGSTAPSFSNLKEEMQKATRTLIEERTKVEDSLLRSQTRESDLSFEIMKLKDIIVSARNWHLGDKYRNGNEEEQERWRAQLNVYNEVLGLPPLD